MGFCGALIRVVAHAPAFESAQVAPLAHDPKCERVTPLTWRIRPQQAKLRTIAYLESLTSRIVRYLCERIEKMVNRGFALKADSVEELQGGDGDGTLRVIRCCGEPPVGEQLLPVRLASTKSALAKVHRDVVKPIRRNHHKLVTAWLSVRAASAVSMPKLDPQTELS